MTYTLAATTPRPRLLQAALNGDREHPASPRTPEELAAEARAAEIEEASGIRSRARIAVGDPAACLIEAAEEGAPERTLIAVGSRGLGAVQRLRLGSVSTKVLRGARGPVLVVYRGPHETERRGRAARSAARQRPSAQPLTSLASGSNIHTA